jgi:hypothetical protein
VQSPSYYWPTVVNVMVRSSRPLTPLSKTTHINQHVLTRLLFPTLYTANEFSRFLWKRCVALERRKRVTVERLACLLPFSPRMFFFNLSSTTSKQELQLRLITKTHSTPWRAPPESTSTDLQRSDGSTWKGSQWPY